MAAAVKTSKARQDRKGTDQLKVLKIQFFSGGYLNLRLGCDLDGAFQKILKVLTF